MSIMGEQTSKMEGKGGRRNVRNTKGEKRQIRARSRTAREKGGESVIRSGWMEGKEWARKGREERDEAGAYIHLSVYCALPLLTYPPPAKRAGSGLQNRCH